MLWPLDVTTVCTVKIVADTFDALEVHAMVKLLLVGSGALDADVEVDSLSVLLALEVDGDATFSVGVAVLGR